MARSAKSTLVEPAIREGTSADTSSRAHPPPSVIASATAATRTPGGAATRAQLFCYPNLPPYYDDEGTMEVVGIEPIGRFE